MEDIGKLALQSGETVTKRMQRIKEPIRTLLFRRVEQRLKEVSDLLGPSASTEDKMVEIYLIGVHDGSQIEKSASRGDAQRMHSNIFLKR